MNADRLGTAARLLEGRAHSATPGPYYVIDTWDMYNPCVSTNPNPRYNHPEPGENIAECGPAQGNGLDDAIHFSGWTPNMAADIAALLRYAATCAEAGNTDPWMGLVDNIAATYLNGTSE